ncbi:hypothetical protein IAQ61_011862 [Plenodomus lingam]|uniref:uncharacterized protein n=1 Tax=Leptosphaeria maculans TaxID=5022 RepID=UPI00331B0521|nr:hypothetical protein IAQ61_011862 [Plenodomus lingam]
MANDYILTTLFHQIRPALRQEAEPAISTTTAKYVTSSNQILVHISSASSSASHCAWPKYFVHKVLRLYSQANKNHRNIYRETTKFITVFLCTLCLNYSDCASGQNLLGTYIAAGNGQVKRDGRSMSAIHSIEFYLYQSLWCTIKFIFSELSS